LRGSHYYSQEKEKNTFEECHFRFQSSLLLPAIQAAEWVDLGLQHYQA
jgi:hypothetical protein